MTKLAGGILSMLALCVMLAAVGRAEAVTPISSCQTLSASGTYQLTANIVVGPIPACLVVAADSVVIDLNGFEITFSGGGPSSDGVSDAAFPRKGTVVRNGTIRGHRIGIFLPASTDSLVDTVILFENENTAVLVGAGSTVKNSTIHDNGHAIFFLGSPGIAKNNTIYKNGHAVDATGQAHMTVSGNTIAQNSDGIVVGDSSTVKDNVLLGAGPAAGANVITGGSHMLVSGNTVLDSTGSYGIRVLGHSTVKDNVVNKNTVSTAAMSVDTHGVVIQNTVLNNTADGIEVNCPSTVKFNTALGNSGTNLAESGSGCTNISNNAP